MESLSTYTFKDIDVDLSKDNWGVHIVCLPNDTTYVLAHTEDVLHIFSYSKGEESKYSELIKVHEMTISNGTNDDMEVDAEMAEQNCTMEVETANRYESLHFYKSDHKLTLGLQG